MADTAQRVRRRLDEVLEEAIEQGIVSLNPVAMLRTKLRRENKKRRRTPHPALGYREVPAFLERLRAQPGVAARCLEFTIPSPSVQPTTFPTSWSAGCGRRNPRLRTKPLRC
jgi:hypothetical protein